MKNFTKLAAIAAVATMTIATTAQAATIEYMRKGDQVIAVSNDSGTLMCTRVSDGFEMCNGMEKQANGAWTGDNMRHPDMPKFMKFNGTVTFTTDGLKIKGCAVGVCQSEDWAKR